MRLRRDIDTFKRITVLCNRNYDMVQENRSLKAVIILQTSEVFAYGNLMSKLKNVQ
jgi:hypothetical protein